ncbi:MAG: hypothetical protein AB7K24_08455 [Gemmataceae bacterium]
MKQQKKRSTSQQQPPISKRYSDVYGVMLYTSLSESTIRRALASGELTAFRPVPGRVLLDLNQVDQWMQSGAISTRGAHLHQA